MNRKFGVFLFLILTLLAFFSHSHVFAEGDVTKTLQLEAAPLDVAVSKNGRWIFVLTDKGEILVYSSDATLKDRMTVGSHVDGIDVGTGQETIYLVSRKNKTVEVFTLEFQKQINITGAPYKGPPNAPVVIAVFTDFE